MCKTYRVIEGLPPKLGAEIRHQHTGSYVPEFARVALDELDDLTGIKLYFGDLTVQLCRTAPSHPPTAVTARKWSA